MSEEKTHGLEEYEGRVFRALENGELQSGFQEKVLKSVEENVKLTPSNRFSSHSGKPKSETLDQTNDQFLDIILDIL